MDYIRVPTLTSEPFGYRDGHAIHTEDMPIEIAPVDDNRVKITMGGTSRIVDGISLVDAIHRQLAARRP